jgi:hypothetical protein
MLIALAIEYLIIGSATQNAKFRTQNPHPEHGTSHVHSEDGSADAV